MLQLVARYEGQLLAFPAPERETTLGSDSGNQITLPFPGVSRRHARLRPVEGGVLVHDAGSKNGIAVGGRRVPEALLAPGVEVRVGPVVLSLEDVSTGDVQMGLSIPHAGGKEPARGATASTPPAEGEPGAALRFVRDVEVAGHIRRAALLARAREVLGATSLVAFVPTPTGIAITDLAGTLPAEAACEELGRVGSAGRARTVAGFPALVAGSGDGTERLAALFENEIPAWRRDLFAYVACKTLDDASGVAPAPTARTERREGEPLRLPDGMIVGASPTFAALLAQIRATVRSDLDVLITGETGTGKELIARTIHASGPSPEGPFVAINCAAIPNELLEAELFGVHPRAATGVDPRPGRFSQADGGTIFLDEVGELAAPVQAKLLRVLQEREVLPLGAPRPQRIAVRVVSASNRDLEELIRLGAFRRDLFYRLRGLQFHLPPLRDRKEDIPDLVLAFTRAAAEKAGRQIRGVSRNALELLLLHEWPGNVRELENEVQRAVLVCPHGGTLRAEHFGPLRWAMEHGSAAATRATAPAPAGGSAEPASVPGATQHDPEPETPLTRGALDIERRRNEVERETILLALRRSKGNKSLAARLLNLSRNGLAARMKVLKIGE